MFRTLGCRSGQSLGRFRLRVAAAEACQGRASFMIGGVAMVLPYGNLYALFNSKRVYITSAVMFVAAFALYGAALNMDADIMGRYLPVLAVRACTLACGLSCPLTRQARSDHSTLASRENFMFCTSFAFKLLCY